MKYHLNILFFACLLLFSSCDNQKNQSVSGVITNGEGKSISLIGYNTKGQPDTIASAVISPSGEFTLPVKGGRLAFYTLAVENNGSLVLAFDSTESPVVSADLNYINRKYEVTGSPESARMAELFTKSMKFETKLDSTMKRMRESTDPSETALRTELSAKYNALRSEYKSYLTGFIDENPASVANFSILQRLDPQSDLTYFQKVRDGLEPKMRGYVFYDALANNIAQMEAQRKASAAFESGAQAPEIALPDPSGNIRTLSSLRGNYVLIDFWASWCKPCRVENPNVVKLYKKYEKENFEIMGVSLDRDKAKWEEAIQADQLTWVHVSDLQFWNSAAAKLYNVTSIPYTMLIDPEGKIIEARLRGAALEAKLQSIYGY